MSIAVPTDTVIAAEQPADHAAIDLLNVLAFGPGRYARSAYRVREQAEHDPRLSLVAKIDGVIVASVRMTLIEVGDRRAWLLGPLVVTPHLKGRGIGKRLVAEAVAAARRTPAPVVLLVGDAPYYGPLGFRPIDTRRVVMPGPVAPGRLLANAPDGLAQQLAGTVRPVPPSEALAAQLGSAA